ncbi:hypothetical protein [Nocardia mangyaensis]|uniref:hypothetical protein n=1 Tax=Nocardia mangyaensis TaxID=2213200 RepID=UPI002675A113|nr:hypothetical protein [Nocardia mangyaensis]MDO3647780.1 hypothetical protein [Nocardia mangyaensis]
MASPPQLGSAGGGRLRHRVEQVARIAIEAHAELALPEPQWQVEHAEKAQREAQGPDGQTAAVTDGILLVRRTRA